MNVGRRRKLSVRLPLPKQTGGPMRPKKGKGAKAPRYKHRVNDD